MQQSSRKYLIIAVICSIFAGLLTFVYLLDLKTPTDSELVSVVLAGADIPQGKQVTKDMLITRSIPSGDAHKSAYNDIAEVIGKVALSPIYANEQILKNRLGSERSGGEASSFIVEGKVAIAIAADEVSAVGGGIRPGDKVDIIATAAKGYGDGGTELLLKDVNVLGIGGRYPFNASVGGSEDSGFSGGSGAFNSLILEVTSEQAVVITKYAETGKLKFALKSKNTGKSKKVER